jgi:hypothetical protein
MPCSSLKLSSSGQRESSWSKSPRQQPLTTDSWTKFKCLTRDPRRLARETVFRNCRNTNKLGNGGLAKRWVWAWSPTDLDAVQRLSQSLGESQSSTPRSSTDSRRGCCHRRPLVLFRLSGVSGIVILSQQQKREPDR